MRAGSNNRLEIEIHFQYHRPVMTSVATPEPVPDGPPERAVPRAMTRCECTGVAFADIVRQVHVEGRLRDSQTDELTDYSRIP